MENFFERGTNLIKNVCIIIINHYNNKQDIYNLNKIIIIVKQKKKDNYNIFIFKVKFIK